MGPECFELIAGSVLGRAHADRGRNNQDACLLRQEGASLLALVSDGCSAGAHSEVGAQLGCALLGEGLFRLAQRATGEPPSAAEWEVLRLEVLARLGALPLPVEHYLLFTIVGALVTPAWACVFHVGDGVILLNGEALLSGSAADNAPPYLAYGCAITVDRVLPAEALRTLVIATDGAAAIPDLPAYCEDDALFRNRDALRRRLVLLSRQRPSPLFDDTTVVALRRRR